MRIDPIYDQFSLNETNLLDLELFATHVNDEKEWKEKSADLEMIESFPSSTERVCRRALQGLFFPWGIYCGIRFYMHQLAGRKIYPAQCRFSKKEISSWRDKVLGEQEEKKRIVRHLRLQKGNTNYSAFLITSKETIANGQWALHASGNQSIVEKECLKDPSYPDVYCQEGFNVLLVNGPGVGLSDPMQSIAQLGDAQELGLHFLESAVKATKIVLTGVSIGGAALSLVIDRHHFLKDRNYLVLRFATFSRLSDVIQMRTGFWGQLMFSQLGYEIDSVSASKKLEELQVPEVIYQNENDRLLKKNQKTAELAASLLESSSFDLNEKEPLATSDFILDDFATDLCVSKDVLHNTKFLHKTFKVISGAGHFYEAHSELSLELRSWLSHLKNKEDVVDF